MGCAPGGPKAAAAIAKIMGVRQALWEKKAVVQCQGSPEHRKPGLRLQGHPDLRRCYSLYGGPKTCSFACIGLGDQTKV